MTSTLKNNCIYCNKEFLYFISEGQKKFCSMSCYSLSRKKIANMNIERSCEYCSTTFMPKYKNQKTCSSNCKTIQSSKKREKIYDFNCKNCNIKCSTHRKNRTTYCSQNCYIDFIQKEKLKKESKWKFLKNCVVCNKEFLPTYPPQKCCSHDCGVVVGAAKQKTAIKLNCFRCNKEFNRTPSDIKEKNFCSWECVKEPLDRICENCGKEYVARIGSRKVSRFCSKSCSKSGKFHHYFGKSSPAKGMIPWSKGLTADTDTRIAELGKKISIILKKQFNSGERTMEGINNPNYGKTISDRTPEQLENYSKAAIKRITDNKVSYNKNSKTGFYFSTKMNKEIKYRSSYEKRFISLLDKDISIKQFEYEPFSIQYNIGKRYLPDFKIEYINGTIELIEVKPLFKLEDETVKLKAQAAMLFCQEKGWNYRFVTLADIEKYEQNLSTLSI